MDLTLHEFEFMRYLMEDAGELIDDIIETVEEQDETFFADETANEELYPISRSAYSKLLMHGVTKGWITQEEHDEAVARRKQFVG